MILRHRSVRAPVLAWGPVLAAAWVTVSCAHGPPPDFAPDPVLVSQIRSIEIRTVSAACPGAEIPADYDAVLADGTHVPFLRSYDKNNPPRLHVVFLERSSEEGVSGSSANWALASDPLLSAATGFRLYVSLRAKPSIQGSATVAPDYSCAPHAFQFTGEHGGGAQTGENGPDVTVRLGIGRSRFYNKLIVASIEAGPSSPFYELYDASAIPPASWIAIESRGGRGGPGSQGPPGSSGSPGAPGCPAQAGGSGGDGGGGGPGAPGGRGGTITIVVPTDQPFLAGLVDARTPGGRGGPGGPGGAGGIGGKGGQGTVGRDGRRCLDAGDGPAGRQGPAGPEGSEGPRGPRPEIVTAPVRDMFGLTVPAVIQTILGQGSR